jgi:16S rRNA (uracil1498-N3)-methyltransferase
MPDRYFCEPPIEGNQARLAGPEAHHLIHVMRAAPGTRVVLFDGSGAEFEADVRRVGRAEVELEVLSHAEVDRELDVEVTLGVALPKGDRQRWLVEKAVELGVGRIVPLATARSVSQPGPRAIARLRRTVIEASKQCGRNKLMEIAAPQPWADWIVSSPDARLRLVAHPCRDEPADVPDRLKRDSVEQDEGACPGPVLLAVGPEGGFTREEIDTATAAGWQLIDLGPRILRVETAAMVLVATAAKGRR